MLTLGFSMTLGLVACGGSGAGKESGPGAGTGSEGPQTPAAPAAPAAPATQQDVKVSLSASSQQLASDGSTPVELTAVLTDVASGVALVGRTVAFAVRDEVSGVRVEIISAETNSSGIAAARLLLNGNSTERDVTVLASVDQKAPAELVVRVAASTTAGPVNNNNRGELTVRLGTDNLIEDLAEQLSYRKRYAVIVTDNAGIAKANVTVLATLRARRYYVGYWIRQQVDGAFDQWVPVRLTPDGVGSEDVADFGTCNAGEDVNNDKVLTPGNIASYSVQSQTDADGVAVLNIVYLKNFATWAQMELEATATVGGSEGFNAITIPLPILGQDTTNEDVAPPNISRTRGSLSTSTAPLPSGAGDEGSMTFKPASTDSVPGSPYPYLSVTPTCP